MPVLPYVSFCFINTHFDCLCRLLFLFDSRTFSLYTSKLHHKKGAYSSSFFCRSISSLIMSFRYLLTLSFVSRYSRMSASCLRWSLKVLILYVLSLRFWFALFLASDTAILLLLCFRFCV